MELEAVSKCPNVYCGLHWRVRVHVVVDVNATTEALARTVGHGYRRANARSGVFWVSRVCIACPLLERDFVTYAAPAAPRRSPKH